MARTATNTFSRTVKVFDENFELKEKTVTGTIPEVKDYPEAVALFGNDEKKIMAALIAAYRTQVISNEIAKATEGGLEERYINLFIKNFRIMPQFSELEGTVQTKAVLQFVKQTPVLFDSLKAFCKAKAEAGDED